MKFEVNERYRHRNLGTVTITNRVGNFVYAHPSWADEDRGVVLTVEEAKELLQPIEEPSSRGEPQPQSWDITFDAGGDVPYSVSYWFGTKAEARGSLADTFMWRGYGSGGRSLATTLLGRDLSLEGRAFRVIPKVF